MSAFPWKAPELQFKLRFESRAETCYRGTLLFEGHLVTRPR